MLIIECAVHMKYQTLYTAPLPPSSYVGDFGALRVTVCPSDLVSLIWSLTPSHHGRTCSPALSCNTAHIIQELML